MDNSVRGLAPLPSQRSPSSHLASSPVLSADSPPSASSSTTTYPTSWVRDLTRICLLSFSTSRRPLALLLHHQALPFLSPFLFLSLTPRTETTKHHLLSLSLLGRASTQPPPFLSSLLPSLFLSARSASHHLSSLFSSPSSAMDVSSWPPASSSQPSFGHNHFRTAPLPATDGFVRGSVPSPLWPQTTPSLPTPALGLGNIVPTTMSFVSA